MSEEISQENIDRLYSKLKKDSETYGYNLNPDEDFTKALIRSLIVNENRYGYQSCPCRLSTGDIEMDRDIICPCDYRDPDLNDYGACYCGLYVNEDIHSGKKELVSIPERRFSDITDGKSRDNDPGSFMDNLKLPVWRCRVCGYLCGREQPPDICPICKAKKDRFEKFF